MSAFSVASRLTPGGGEIKNNCFFAFVGRGSSPPPPLHLVYLVISTVATSAKKNRPDGGIDRDRGVGVFVLATDKLPGSPAVNTTTFIVLSVVVAPLIVLLAVLLHQHWKGNRLPPPDSPAYVVSSECGELFQVCFHADTYKLFGSVVSASWKSLHTISLAPPPYLTIGEFM